MPYLVGLKWCAKSCQPNSHENICTKKKRFGTHGCGELQSSCRRFNPPTPTCQCIKLIRDVGELVFNPVQLIRS